MRYLQMPFAILYVIYLRYNYKRLTIKWQYNQSNQHLAVLRLLQAKIHYFHSQFSPWGYYHPSCVYTNKHERFIDWLFPQRDYKELELLVWSNPKAVTWYHNYIYNSNKKVSIHYASSIEKQLKKWNYNY